MSRLINVQHLGGGNFLAYYESWPLDCVRVFEWVAESREWVHAEDLPRVVFNEVQEAEMLALPQAEEEE